MGRYKGTHSHTYEHPHLPSPLPCQTVADEVMMKTHKLQGMELQVKPYEESSMATAHSEHHDILEVSDLPDGVSEGLIELYFEDSKKSGGCANAVKGISFVRPRVARIQFTSDTGMSREWFSATACNNYTMECSECLLEHPSFS